VTRDARWNEVSTILAQGIIRLQRRAIEQLNCSENGEVGLDFTADQSVCATVSTAGKTGTCGGRQ